MGSPFDALADCAFTAVNRVFGEEAELYYRGGGSAHVKGIFLRSSVLSGDGMSIADFVSTFDLKPGAFQPPKKSDAIRVRGDLYKIAEVQKDSADVLKLILQKEKRIKNVKKV